MHELDGECFGAAVVGAATSVGLTGLDGVGSRAVLTHVNRAHGGGYLLAVLCYVVVSEGDSGHRLH